MLLWVLDAVVESLGSRFGWVEVECINDVTWYPSALYPRGSAVIPTFHLSNVLSRLSTGVLVGTVDTAGTPHGCSAFEPDANTDVSPDAKPSCIPNLISATTSKGVGSG
jgi:hypothetical protein